MKTSQLAVRMLGRTSGLACFICLLASSANSMNRPLARAAADEGLVTVGQEIRVDLNEYKTANIKQKLAEAIDFQDQIREWLFDNGHRMTKELVASTRASFSAESLLFGLYKEASGNYQANQYKELLHGGEQFVVTALDDNTMQLLDQIEIAAKPHGEHQCVSDMRRHLRRFRQVKQDLPRFKNKLARFHSLLTSIRAQMALDEQTLTPSAAKEYAELALWAKNTSVQFKEIGMADGYTIKNSGYFSDGRIYLANDGVHHLNCAMADESFDQLVKFGDVLVVDAGELRIY